MQNPRLATRYAKSLIDLATERGQLEEVNRDMRYLHQVCSASREFVNLLKSPVFHADKKASVLEAVTSGHVGELTKSFNRLLITKAREINLPEIVDAFIVQYNKLNDIHVVKLITAIPVSEQLKNDIIAKIKSTTPIQKIELTTAVDESLIGGFVLEFDNNLVDASVARDLRDIKAQFEGNIYEQRIR